MVGWWSWLVPLALVFYSSCGMCEVLPHTTKDDDSTRLARLEQILNRTQDEQKRTQDEQKRTQDELKRTQDEQKRTQDELKRTQEEMLKMKADLDEVRQNDKEKQDKTYPLTCKIGHGYRDYRPIPYLIEGKTAQIHGDCQDAFAKGWNNSGIYTIMPDGSATFNVYCQFDEGQKDFRPEATMNVSKIFRNCRDAYARGWKQSGLYTVSENGIETQDVCCKQGLSSRTVFTSCMEAYQSCHRQSGMYIIRTSDAETRNIYCEQGLDGGGWEVFQQRIDDSIDFYRDWASYRGGFGNRSPGGNYWLGLEAIHQLTKDGTKRLKIELSWPDGRVQYADYSSFWLDDVSLSYRLHVDGYSGNASYGDRLVSHNLQQFTTWDHDRDQWSGGNCGVSYHGGWWYNSCALSNLNGGYGVRNYKVFYWYAGSSPLAGSRMMVK